MITKLPVSLYQRETNAHTLLRPRTCEVCSHIVGETLSSSIFGCLSLNTIQRPICHFVVCEATANKRAYSAAKRSQQAEKRRIYNKARKSKIKIRMKKKPHFLLIWPES